MKGEGYKNTQIAKHMNISSRTVKRLLTVNPELMCVDGTSMRKTHKILDPYRKQIQELVEHGFQTAQILVKLKEMFPGIRVKRTTLSDYCVKLREELYDIVHIPADEEASLPVHSILSPYVEIMKSMLADNKQLTVIFDTIKSAGYTGSYSLLQQICQKVKPKTYRTKKDVRKIKRRELAKLVWSGYGSLSQQDIEHIKMHYPVLNEIECIISEFRVAYSERDVESVRLWCKKYMLCQFPAICSFINGIAADTDAFYNSMKFVYNNGLLEGCVNKLKAVKRSMFGRASYELLRAKMLLPYQL